MGYRKTFTLEEAAAKYQKYLERKRREVNNRRARKREEKTKKFMEKFKAKYG